MPKGQQQELPGMPEKPKRDKKFFALHQAILDVCELLEGFDIPAGAQVKLDPELNGNKISIIYKAQDDRI